MLRKLKFVARDLKRDLAVYQMALKDRRTPKLAKLLLGFAVAYALSPIDIIPDFIPLIGHVDDALIIPVVIRIALSLIPDEVLDDCRLRIGNGASAASPRKTAKRRRTRLLRHGV